MDRRVKRTTSQRHTVKASKAQWGTVGLSLMLAKTSMLQKMGKMEATVSFNHLRLFPFTFPLPSSLFTSILLMCTHSYLLYYLLYRCFLSPLLSFLSSPSISFHSILLMFTHSYLLYYLSYHCMNLFIFNALLILAIIVSLFLVVISIVL